ncbi:MAG: HAMP domain-containing protein [Rickettsiales bacterium]|nr:HAMP domain-containing protein [Rickettsiales bacterium]
MLTGHFTTAKTFVDTQTNAMKHFLNLKSDVNALAGIYLSTNMLTNEQYIIPMQEKYIASKAAINYTVENIDNSHSEIKTTIASYLAHGEGEDSLFNKVAVSIALTNQLEAKKASISNDNLAINQILTKMSSAIDEKSQSSIAVMSSKLTMASIVVTSIWLIFIVSAGYMVWFYIRPKIIGRLHTLNEEMNQVREGNLDTDVTVEGHDEITDMSNALLRFRDDARQALQDQNEREKERERQKLEQQRLLENQEQRIMDDVSEIITACGQGDFTKRIDEGEKEGLSLFLARFCCYFLFHPLDSRSKVQE